MGLLILTISCGMGDSVTLVSASGVHSLFRNEGLRLR